MELALRSTDLSVCNVSRAPTAIGNSLYAQKFESPLITQSTPKTALHIYLRMCDFMQYLRKAYNNPNDKPKDEFWLLVRPPFSAEPKRFAPLEQIFWLLTKKIVLHKSHEHETNAIIQRALKKENGYFIRLFSKENWGEWAEDRTALGRVVSLFKDYCESSAPIAPFMKRLSSQLVEEANFEARRLIADIRVYQRNNVETQEYYDFVEQLNKKYWLERVVPEYLEVFPSPPSDIQKNGDAYIAFMRNNLKKKGYKEALNAQFSVESDENKPIKFIASLKQWKKWSNLLTWVTS